MNKNKSSQNGFTLIEIAMVILILGLIVGAVFSFLSVQREEREQSQTVEREQKIAGALAYYAQTHNKLPCPAKTKPALSTTAVGTPENLTCDTGTTLDRTGVVPFRVLGLTQQDVTDGFGNPISYTVSKIAVNPPDKVHDDCRDSNWISGTNVNAPKAKFCCQQDFANGDPNRLRVFSDPVALTPATDIQDGTESANYQDVDSNTAGNNSGKSKAYFAYVLVSHGKNGKGSYKFCQGATTDPSCTNTRADLIGAGDDEAENFDDDNDFVAKVRSTGSGSSYFDDIVLWRTQSGVINELNNDSCVNPNVN